MKYMGLISMNIMSGLSLAILIIFGVTYVSFKNASVYQDIIIEIVNNPIDGDDIMFSMLGTKPFDCNSTEVFGVAYRDGGPEEYLLNLFTKQYVHNTRSGEPVTNKWTMQRPKEMQAGGNYRVTMVGEFECHHWIFQVPKVERYENILLVAKPLDNT